MLRRCISLMLVIMVTLSFVLAGCGSGNSQTNTATSSAVEQTNTAGTTTAETTKAPEPPTTIKVMTFDTWNADFPISKGIPVEQEFEKRANVKVEWITATFGEQYDQIFQTRFAAGVDLPDLVQGNSTMTDMSALNLAKQGLVVPVNDLIDKYGPNIKKNYIEAHPSLYKSTIAPDGKNYWIAGIGGCALQNATPIIRKDWLDKVGITKLPETTDEFYAALKTMQDNDANGNGKKDEILVTEWSWGIMYLAPGAFGLKHLSGSAADPSQAFIEGNDGKIVNAWVTDEAKNYLAWLSKLYKEDLLEPEVMTIGWEKTQAEYNKNVCSAAVGAMYWGPNTTQTMDKAGVKGSKYVNLMPLKGSDGKTGLTMEPEYKFAYWFITKDCKVPEAVMRYLDFIFSDEGQIIEKHGIEGQDWVRTADGKIDNSKYLEKAKTDTSIVDRLGVYASFFPKIEFINADEYSALRSSLVPFGWDLEAAKKFDEATTPLGWYKTDFAMPTEAEVSLLDSLPKDLWNYMKEMTQKFLLGTEPLSDWDAYVKKCKELGLDKATQAKQEQFDRFNASN